MSTLEFYYDTLHDHAEHCIQVALPGITKHSFLASLKWRVLLYHKLRVEDAKHSFPGASRHGMIKPALQAIGDAGQAYSFPHPKIEERIQRIVQRSWHMMDESALGPQLSGVLLISCQAHKAQVVIFKQMHCCGAHLSRCLANFLCHFLDNGAIKQVRA